eukprot:m.115410 g.115410  ORF g.115410 m.115410 type:complete len:956 (+) comp9476_c0_seq2:3-2870(+)
MGKSNGKRKAPPDFKKKKAKVGRKQIAENATNTTFKSRSIHVATRVLPTQGEATSDRGQTLQDLLAKIAHHNAGMRRDAVQGLRSLFERHPERLDAASVLMLVFQRTAPCVSDVASSVRQATLALFRDILGAVSGPRAAPFFSLLLVHVCSAMTHLAEDVRVDSLAFVDILLEHYPQLCVAHSSKLLVNFLQLVASERRVDPTAPAAAVASGARSLLVGVRNATAASPHARMSVLKRLQKLLTLAFTHGDGAARTQDVDMDTTTDLPADRSYEWGGNAAGALFALPPQARTVPPKTAAQSLAKSSGSGLADSADASSAAAARAREAAPEVVSSASSWEAAKSWSLMSPEDIYDFFFQDLLPILLECWLEHSPADLDSDSTPAIVFAEMQTLLDLMDVVISQLVQFDLAKRGEWERNTITKFQKHFLPYFPLGQRNANSQSAQAILSLNVTICHLFSFFAEINLPSIVGTSLDFAALSVGYLAKVPELYEEFTPALLDAVLDAIQRWIASPHIDASQLLSAVLALYSAAHDQSRDKRILLLFLADVILKRGAKLSKTSVLAKWISSLPKLLWQLKTKSTETSLRILELLATLARQEVMLESGAPIVDAILPKLSVFFHTTAKGKHIFGPFALLPIDAQRAAVSLLFYSTNVPDSIWRAAAMCIQLENTSTEITGYLLETLCPLRSDSFSPMSASMVLSTALGYSQGKLVELEAEVADDKDLVQWSCGHMCLVAPFRQRLDPNGRVQNGFIGQGSKGQAEAEAQSFWSVRLGKIAVLRDHLRVAADASFLADALLPHFVKLASASPIPMDAALGIVVTASAMLSAHATVTPESEAFVYQLVFGLLMLEGSTVPALTIDELAPELLHASDACIALLSAGRKFLNSIPASPNSTAGASGASGAQAVDVIKRLVRNQRPEWLSHASALTLFVNELQQRVASFGASFKRAVEELAAEARLL